MRTRLFTHLILATLLQSELCTFALIEDLTQELEEKHWYSKRTFKHQDIRLLLKKHTGNSSPLLPMRVLGKCPDMLKLNYNRHPTLVTAANKCISLLDLEKQASIKTRLIRIRKFREMKQVYCL